MPIVRFWFCRAVVSVARQCIGFLQYIISKLDQFLWGEEFIEGL